MSVEFLKTLFGDKALTFDEFAKAVGDSKKSPKTQGFRGFVKHANYLLEKF